MREVKTFSEEFVCLSLSLFVHANCLAVRNFSYYYILSVSEFLTNTEVTRLEYSI